MKKNILLLLFIALSISACEKDDFCTQSNTTPKLILRFYDATNTSTLKSTDSLYVWAEGKDSILSNESTDSIAIPLNSLNTNTVYNLSKGTLLTNQFTISYTTEDEYVSRSCGYKVTFNDLSITNNSITNTWIKSFTPDTLTNINNQTTAHVQIFH